MIIGTPGLDYVSLGLVDADKLPKCKLKVEDRRGYGIQPFKDKKKAIEALPEGLREIALVPNLSPFHANRFMAALVPDLLKWLNFIKKENFEKVDWVMLIWVMMEQELKAPQLDSCYYVSHLHQLIKVQHEELLEEVVEVVEEENKGKDKVEEEEEDEGMEEEVDGSGM
ncbi:hypothetical protein VNO78_08112 [Psophocarpus tetragonolobus]|uniref:Uncharacterized protein n=1 Tax=Psophocarpus tetragonolobus TaxID=3891 RepID=A0AAN9SVF9_PSOTE